MNSFTGFCERHRPRVLFVAPAMPAADGNGLAMRMGMFLEAYANLGEVHCLIVPLTGSAIANAFCTRHARRLEVIGVAGRAETPFALLAAVADTRERVAAFRRYGQPSLVAFLSTPVREEIRTRVQAHSYDIVHISRAYLAPLAGLIASLYPRARIILDLDEDEPSTRRSLARLYRQNGDFANAEWQEAEAAAYQRLITAVLPAIHLSIVSSANEANRAFASAPSRSPIAIVPNAVAIPAMPPKSTLSRGLIFVGSFAYFPNHDAALWIVRSIWPRIAKRCPQATLSLVGRRPNTTLRRVARQPGVRLCADVADVGVAYRSCSIALVPIRAGGGTRIKLLEAGAYALPCVSTSVGAEGLILAGLAMADDSETFADTCVEFLRSPALRLHMGLCLRSFVQRHHDRGSIVRLIRQLVSTLYDGAGVARAYAEPEKANV
jgi:polysaccharide biosynthesis protein PslH